MILRLATERDGAGVAEIYDPIVRSTAISFEVDPPGEIEMSRRIGKTLPAYPWLVCEHHGRIAGYAYASSHKPRAAYQWSVETSVYIHADFRRCGVGRGLYQSLFQILKAQGFCSVYAGATLPNAGSAGLHESAGFQPVGIYRNAGYKMGSWHDVGWWQLALQPQPVTPQPPLSIDQLRSDPGWQQLLDAGLPPIREPR
jgi:phosphinothricin acetyltransferase